MQQTIKQFFLLLCIILVLTLPYFVFADNNPALSGLEGVREPIGFAEANEFTLAKTIGTFIQAILSLLGLIFVGLMIYAGVNWMIAAGDSNKIEIAKNTIRRAIIGLIITASSYAIWYFVFSAIS